MILNKEKTDVNSLRLPDDRGKWRLDGMWLSLKKDSQTRTLKVYGNSGHTPVRTAAKHQQTRRYCARWIISDTTHSQYRRNLDSSMLFADGRRKNGLARIYI